MSARSPASILLLLPLLAGAPALAGGTPTPEQAEAIAGVEKDREKLLDLARGWAAAGDETAAAAAFQRVVALDPENAEARAGLRHHRYDGRWFATWTELAKYRQAEEKRMFDEQGLVRFRDRWVRPEDRAFARLGFEKDGAGRWTSPATRARLAREAELAAQGHERQDLTWIPPAEFDRWREQLWKCGDAWLGNEEADRYHAEPSRPWTVESEHFVVVSTCDREAVEWIKWWADRTYDDLVRVFGVTPGSVASAAELFGEKRDKPTVAVFRSLAQYNDFAAGDPAAGRSPTEAEGFSSLHYAFHAGAWFDHDEGELAYRGGGVGFWDRGDAAIAPYGQHAVRHAAAQAFVEAIDPSWQSYVDVSQGRPIDAATFWGEKRIPRWLRYGAASYVERWFVDREAKDGADPSWARTWAAQNLKQSGGFLGTARVFELDLSLDHVDASTQIIHQAGLVVAYVLDGGDPKVEQAHAAFRAALQKGEGVQAAVIGLQEALQKSESKIRQFLDR